MTDWNFILVVIGLDNMDYLNVVWLIAIACYEIELIDSEGEEDSFYIEFVVLQNQEYSSGLI